MTDNRIGDEGAKSMSEMLKVNTTLSSLDLRCEEERKERRERKERMTDNWIEVQGKIMLRDGWDGRGGYLHLD